MRLVLVKKYLLPHLKSNCLLFFIAAVAEMPKNPTPKSGIFYWQLSSKEGNSY